MLLIKYSRKSNAAQLEYFLAWSVLGIAANLVLQRCTLLLLTLFSHISCDKSSTLKDCMVCSFSANLAAALHCLLMLLLSIKSLAVDLMHIRWNSHVGAVQIELPQLRLY